jgi:hypothetical protein
MQSAEIFLYSLDDLVLISHKPQKLLDLPFSSSELLGAAGLEGRLQSAVGLFDVCFRCVGRHTGREHRELGNFILLQPEKDRLFQIASARFRGIWIWSSHFASSKSSGRKDKNL